MKERTEFVIRSLTQADEPFLWEALYHALYVPEGHSPFPRDVVQQPELRRYAEGWGRPGDMGVIALVNDEPAGAAWLRLIRGYGYVDEATPELSIAVLPDYRGQGIGTQLFAQLIETASYHFGAISLSVSSDNQARRLYERFGFRVVGESGVSLTMVRHLGKE